MKFATSVNGTYQDAVDKMMNWLSDHVTRTHPDLGRRGPICPFMKSALETDSIKYQICSWGNDYGPVELQGMINELIAIFCRSPWHSSKPNLQSLISVFPTMPKEKWVLLDDLFRKTQDDVIDHSLMVAQFHPDCTQPAIWNPQFAVNRAPLPLFAVRRMQVHDIIFVRDNPAWLQAYRSRFSKRYDDNTISDTYLIDLFTEAKNKYLSPADRE
jgi:hypothetical protein